MLAQLLLKVFSIFPLMQLLFKVLNLCGLISVMGVGADFTNKSDKKKFNIHPQQNIW